MFLTCWGEKKKKEKSVSGLPTYVLNFEESLLKEKYIPPQHSLPLSTILKVRLTQPVGFQDIHRSKFKLRPSCIRIWQ